MKVFLIILAGIIGVILLLLYASVTLRIYYDDELRLSVRYLGITFYRYPKKKKKIKISDYTYAKTHGQKKKLKASQNKQTTSKKPERDIASTAKNLVGVLKKIAESTSKKLRVRLAKIHISVSSDDAAKTAITYGIVSSSVACAVGLLEEFTALAPAKHNDVRVDADFVSGKSTCDIKIIMKLRLHESLGILTKLFYNYLKQKNKVADASAITEDNTNG